MSNYFSYKPFSSLAYRERTTYKKKILDRDNHTCQLCGKPGNIVDHIIPWRVSHDNSESNLRCLCRKCNLDTRRPRKDSCLPLDQWWQYIEAQAGMA